MTDISLAVARGETLAIVGATGSGKSTLLALLPRFYDATAGEVFVDGVDVRTYALRALRQRLALARAILRKPEILLLDDSTSALDLRTESAFYRTLDDYTETLHREGHSLTKIIVAQRIATARRADRIAVLDGGRLVACGSHESLLASCPVYQEICASQLRAKSGKGE